MHFKKRAHHVNRARAVREELDARENLNDADIDGGETVDHVYIVVRRSADCAPNMVEIVGTFASLSDAESMRDHVFSTTGKRCVVETYWPQPAGRN